jgi:hypothetical protein
MKQNRKAMGDAALPGPPGDPEFDDQVPSGVDPDGQDFRDELDVTNALGELGVVQGIDAELEEQQRAREHDTLEVLEALRGLDAGQTVKWRITRNGTGDPNFDGFLDTWPTKLVTLERIRDKMGGGTYYLKGFRNGKYWVHKTVEIAGEPKLYKRDEGGTVVAPTGTGFDLSQFLAQQEARDARRRQEESERRREDEEREEKRRQERKDMMIALGPAFLAAAAQIFSGNRGPDLAALITAVKPPPQPDPMQQLAALKALMGGNNSSVAERMLPLLLDKVTDSGSTGETGWMDIAKELVKSAGPTVGGMIEGAIQQARMAQAVPVTATDVTPQPAAPQLAAAPQVPQPVRRRERRTIASERSPVESVPSSARVDGSVVDTVGVSSNRTISGGGSEMNMLALLPHLPWLKDQLGRMGQAAAKGRDPEVYAAMFLEELPDGIDIVLVGQLLSRSDWYAQLVQIEPRLNREDLAPWFEVLRAHLVASIQAELQGVGQASAPQPVASTAPAPTRATVTEIQRPTKLPSLTGED